MENISRIKEYLLILKGFHKTPPRTTEEHSLLRSTISDLVRALNTLEELLHTDEHNHSYEKINGWRNEISDALDTVLLSW